MSKKRTHHDASPSRATGTACADAPEVTRGSGGPATMQDVADLAGVSRATVSKYFNGSEGLRLETRSRIEEACRQLHYIPDPHAVSLVKGRSNLVGVILPAIGEPFFAEVLEVVETEAAALGLQLVIQCSYSDPAREAAALLALRSMKVRGIVLTAVASKENANLLKRLERDVRIVYLDSYVRPDCHYVMNDNIQTAGLLTRYLLSRGHRPAFMGAPAVAFPSPDERAAGYVEAMREADLPPCLIPFSATDRSWEFESFALQHTLNWLGSGAWAKEKCTAVVCGTDRLAIGVMAAFRRFGMEPGRDVAIVGHDDLTVSEFLHPALTTVKQDIVSIGRAVIDCLQLGDEAFTSSAPYYQRRFPGKLIVRASA